MVSCFLRQLTELGHGYVQKHFCRSHGFKELVGPESMNWDSDILPGRLFVEGDIVDPRWYHLLTNELFDMALMSPPCPPWSKATVRQCVQACQNMRTQLIRPRTVCYRKYAQA